MLDALREIVATVRAHSRWSDGPLERLGGLALDLVTSPAMVHVAVGSWLSALGAVYLGRAPPSWFYWWSAVLSSAIATYAIGDEIRFAVQAARDELDTTEESGREFQ